MIENVTLCLEVRRCQGYFMECYRYRQTALIEDLNLKFGRAYERWCPLVLIGYERILPNLWIVLA